MQFIRHYLLALQFFTRIPVTGKLANWVGYSPAMLRASAAHFPGVGWLVGALLAGLSALLWRVSRSILHQVAFKFLVIKVSVRIYYENTMMIPLMDTPGQEK